MSFREKIDKILEIKDIRLWKLGEEVEMKSTLEKAYKENREMTDRKTEFFLQKLGINRKWWYSGDGEIFLNDTNETEQQSINETIIESVYKDLIEANTPYRLVPKTILDEEYRIVLKSEIDSKEKLLYEVIESKNNLIAQLKNEIRELRESHLQQVSTKKA